VILADLTTKSSVTNSASVSPSGIIDASLAATFYTKFSVSSLSS
jgi:hypothetical protein